MRLAAGIVLVWIVSVSSIAAAQGAATPAETAFVFDWPAGTDATVVATRVIQNPFRGSTISSEARFSLAVTRAAGTTTLTSRELALAPIRERMAEAAGLGSLEMSMAATLVTEPRTLLPHRCEVRTRRRYAITVGGATRQMEELEIRTWRFTYRPGSAAC
ncbi:hypothetical protein DB32_002281 [Sandaracinus amylolyticus]|uniref:DUF4426 domain-containing protein n=2 Tax=Sandaracinus amylolyticus TaxID=927083 RepID=A0A0F6YGV5_9BACT|nr:hypothetical protein DB32_002281 [Sandaracinus amylolyticus]